MDTIFVNLENSNTNKPHLLSINLTDKSDLKKTQRQFSLSNLSTFCTGNSEYKNNKVTISAPQWDEELELFDSLHIFGCFNTTHQ